MINLLEKLIKIGLSLISPFPLFISAKILFAVLFRVDIFENYHWILIIIIPIGILFIDLFTFKITPIWEEIRSHPNIVPYFLCISIYAILGLIINMPSDIMIIPNVSFIMIIPNVSFIMDIVTSLLSLFFIIAVSAFHVPKK